MQIRIKIFVPRKGLIPRGLYIFIILNADCKRLEKLEIAFHFFFRKRRKLYKSSMIQLLVIFYLNRVLKKGNIRSDSFHLISVSELIFRFFYFVFVFRFNLI